MIIKEMKMQQRTKKKYFLEEEFNETLDRVNKITQESVKAALARADNQDMAIIIKSYTFNCTGALY